MSTAVYFSSTSIKKQVADELGTTLGMYEYAKCESPTYAHVSDRLLGQGEHPTCLCMDYCNCQPSAIRCVSPSGVVDCSSGFARAAIAHASVVDAAVSSSALGEMKALVVIIWAIGLLWVVIRLVEGVGHLAWLSAHAKPLLDDDWSRAVAEICRELNIGRSSGTAVRQFCGCAAHLGNLAAGCHSSWSCLRVVRETPTNRDLP